MSRLLYYGTNLVNEKGQIERKPYDAPKEAYAELAKLAPADRAALQTELYQRNFYRGKSKPSTGGFDPADIDAMKELLNTSNEYGYNPPTCYSSHEQLTTIVEEWFDRKLKTMTLEEALRLYSGNSYGVEKLEEV
jgi:hypothetical protein